LIVLLLEEDYSILEVLNLLALTHFFSNLKLVMDLGAGLKLSILIVDEFFVELPGLLLPNLHLLLVFNAQVVQGLVLPLEVIHPCPQLPEFLPCVLRRIFPDRLAQHRAPDFVFGWTGTEIVQGKISIATTEVDGMLRRLHSRKIGSECFSPGISVLDAFAAGS
jgi:hypothetical protein